MKKKIATIVLLGCILGLNVELLAHPILPDNTNQSTSIEKKHSSPHSLHLSYGLLMHKETYKIFTKMPIMHFTLDYAYEIKWRYQSTNFFILSGCGYIGGRREKGLYKSFDNIMYEYYTYDQIHIYNGIGFRVYLPYSLDVSFSTALCGMWCIEVANYPSYYNHSEPYDKNAYYIERYKNPFGQWDMQCRLSLFLTYKIECIRVFAGGQAYIGKKYGHWTGIGFPSCLWATLGVGYRF